jgi:cytidylate kinase
MRAADQRVGACHQQMREQDDQFVHGTSWYVAKSQEMLRIWQFAMHATRRSRLSRRQHRSDGAA